jgi:hypothetical protein
MVRSRDLLKVVSSILPDSVPITFGPPRTSDEIQAPTTSTEADSIHMVPLSVWPQEQVEPTATSNEASGTSSPKVEPSNPPTQEPKYWGQPRSGHSGRSSPMLKSLANGLRWNPLLAITRLLPMDHTRGKGRLTPEIFVDKLVHYHYLVSCAYLIFLVHLLYLAWYLSCRVVCLLPTGTRSFRKAYGSTLMRGSNFESWFGC